MITVSDHDSCHVHASNMRSDRLVLSCTYQFLTDGSLQSTDKDQQESRDAAGKPHVPCRCKIRYVSKLTAASRGFPCDSRAFLLENYEGQETQLLQCVRYAKDL